MRSIVDPARASWKRLGFFLRRGVAAIAIFALVGCQLIGGIRDRQLEEPDVTTTTSGNTATTMGSGGSVGSGGGAGSTGGSTGVGGATGGAGGGVILDASDDVAIATDGAVSDRGSPSDAAPSDAGSADAMDGGPHVGATSFSQLSAGVTMSCGVMTANGSVVCWGHSVGAIPAGVFSQVSVGGTFACGLKTTGEVVCWGDNGFGQTTSQVGVFASVTTGDSHACAQRADMSAVCWGNNQYGQAATPTSYYTQVNAGGDRTCVLGFDNVVNCWGAGMTGQVRVEAGALFAQVSAGTLFSCGLKKDKKTVSCWDNKGIESFANTGDFLEIGTGASHVCALATSGTVACWGSNTYGESAAPAAGTFLHVTAGDGYSCAMKTDHRAVCWGNDELGQASPP